MFFHHYGLFTLAEMASETDSKPNDYFVLCRTFHIAQSRTGIPTIYFCVGQESKSAPVSDSAMCLSHYNIKVFLIQL